MTQSLAPVGLSPGSEFVAADRERYFHSWDKRGQLTHVYKCDRVLISYGKRDRYPPKPLKPWESEETRYIPSPKGLCGAIICRPVFSHRPVGTMCIRCEEIAEQLERDLDRAEVELKG